MRRTILAALIAMIVPCGSVSAVAQTTRAAAAPERAADEKSFTAAIAAYDRTAKAIIEADYATAARSLADNRRPIVPPERQDDAEVAKAVASLRKNEADVKKTAAVTKAVQKIRPELAQATVQETEIRGRKATLLKVPLKGSRQIAAEHGMTGRGGGWTSTADGDLVILMCNYDGQWFWNPFGW